jgi:hypothetical protein
LEQQIKQKMISDEDAMEIVSKATSTPFLIKLWTILAEPGFSHAISWNRDNRGFTIHDNDALETDVLPSYFRSTQFSSFQRQLNYFAFRKVGKKGYAHALFDRAQPQLVLQIKRKTNTGNLNKKRQAVSRSRRKQTKSNENRDLLQNTTAHNVPSTPPNNITQEPKKKRARISPSVPQEYSTAARPKIVAVVKGSVPKAPTYKIPSVRPSKKYDHDPDLQPVTPMTPFLSDLADFNWQGIKTPLTSRSALCNVLDEVRCLDQGAPVPSQFPNPHKFDTA